MCTLCFTCILTEHIFAYGISNTMLTITQIFHTRWNGRCHQCRSVSQGMHHSIALTKTTSTTIFYSNLEAKDIYLKPYVWRQRLWWITKEHKPFYEVNLIGNVHFWFVGWVTDIPFRLIRAVSMGCRRRYFAVLITHFHNIPCCSMRFFNPKMFNTKKISIQLWS